MLNHLTSTHIPRAAVILAISLSAPIAGAASHCKGIGESACASDTSCTWVQSYTRKDGRQVKSHCKLARGSKPVDVSLVEPEKSSR